MRNFGKSLEREEYRFYPENAGRGPVAFTQDGVTSLYVRIHMFAYLFEKGSGREKLKQTPH